MSVVIPCYNAQPYFGRTLESLQAQTLVDWECIVVDDGSTDDSMVLVDSRAASDARIAVVHQPNGGVSRARNTGYSACSPASRYLLFLDADDYLEPSMLEVLVDYLERHSDVCLVFCEFVCIDEDDRVIQANDPRVMKIVRYVPARFGVRTLPPSLHETPFTSIFGVWAGLLPSNSLLRRSEYAATPGWDESLGRPGEDTDIFLHMALLGPVHYVPWQLVRYRRHTAQFTNEWARGTKQDHNLFRKWAHMGRLTLAQQALLRRALWFREVQLMPRLWVKYGTSHLRAGRFVEGTKCYFRAVKQLILGLRSSGMAVRCGFA